MFYAYDPTFLSVLCWTDERNRDKFLSEYNHYKICTYEEACAMNPWVEAGLPTDATKLKDIYLYKAIGYYPVWSMVHSETDKTPYYNNVSKVIEYEKRRRASNNA